MMTKKMYLQIAYDIAYREICIEHPYPGGTFTAEEEMKEMTTRAIIKLARKCAEYISGDTWENLCCDMDWLRTKHSRRQEA